MVNSFKMVWMNSIIAIGFVLGACWITSLPFASMERPRLIGHHISNLRAHGTDLYFGAGYCLYRLAIPEKKLQAVICTKNWTFQQPAIDGQRAYAHTVASPGPGLSFFAVDLATGEEVWRSRVQTGEAPFRSIKDTISIVEGKLYTANREMVYSLDPASGTTFWQSDFNWMGFTEPFLIHDNLLWYPVAQDNDNDGKLIGLDLMTGETQQTIDLRPEAYFDELLYIDDEWILGLDNRLEASTPSHNHIFAVDPANPNQVLWYSDNLVGLFESSQPFRHDNLFIVSEGSSFVYALDINSGQLKWTFSPSQSSVPGELKSTQLVIFELGTTIYGLEAISGQLIWKYQLREGGYGPPLSLVVEDIVYVGNVNSIDALEKKSGRLLWQISVNSEYEYVKDFP